jgi:hypothetical protein
MAATLVVVSGVALAAVIDCTGGLCPGTNNNDTMTGTAGFDDMRGRDGADRMSARAGNDRLTGGSGGDEISGNTDPETVYGGTGTDTVNTFGGDDVVDVADGDARDFVDCHIGTNDTVEVDRRLTIFGFRVVDTHQNCENVIVRTSF